MSPSLLCGCGCLMHRSSRPTTGVQLSDMSVPLHWPPLTLPSPVQMQRSATLPAPGGSHRSALVHTSVRASAHMKLGEHHDTRTRMGARGEAYNLGARPLPLGAPRPSLSKKCPPQGRLKASQVLIVIADRHVLRLLQLLLVLRNERRVDLDLWRLGKLPHKLQVPLVGEPPRKPQPM